MIERTFTPDQLNNWGIPYEENAEDEPTTIHEDRSIGHGRWSDRRVCVFTAPDDGLTYRVGYCVGLTEMQEEEPWEYENTVKGTRVEPHEVTVTEWRQVKPGNGDRDRTAEYRDVITGRLETIANQADAEGHPACADAIRKTFREVAEEL